MYFFFSISISVSRYLLSYCNVRRLGQKQSGTGHQGREVDVRVEAPRVWKMANGSLSPLVLRLSLALCLPLSRARSFPPCLICAKCYKC